MASKTNPAIEIRSVPREEFRSLFAKHRPEIFSVFGELNTSIAMSEEEIALLKTLGSPLREHTTRIHLCAYIGDELAGWSFGLQTDHEKFYMVNSAVFPQMRRQGVYTSLLEEMIKRTREMGFQIVYSKHAATNNAVIIAKLKAGFFITGMEVSDNFGTGITLSKFFNEKRAKALKFRTGEAPFDDDIKAMANQPLG